MTANFANDYEKKTAKREYNKGNKIRFEEGGISEMIFPTT